MKLNRFLILLPTLILLAGCAGSPFAQAQKKDAQVEVSGAQTTEPLNYDNYAYILKTYVNKNAMVDYQGLQKKRQKLDTFNETLSTVTTETYDSWEQAEQIAFWTNAYNSLTLQSIVDQNPIKKSIRDIPGVWRGRKFQVVGGQSKTLDNIEHKTLRVDFNEPRIHMALVCAAVSCPPLRNEPYTGEKLDAQLEDQTRQFLASSHGFRIDRAAGEVHLSAIFQWFGEDWKATYGIEEKFTGNANERAVLNFISGYLNPDDRAYLEGGDYKVKYLDYDWALNKQ